MNRPTRSGLVLAPEAKQVARLVSRGKLGEPFPANRFEPRLTKEIAQVLVGRNLFTLTQTVGCIYRGVERGYWVTEHMTLARPVNIAQGEQMDFVDQRHIIIFDDEATALRHHEFVVARATEQQRNKKL